MGSGMHDVFGHKVLTVAGRGWSALRRRTFRGTSIWWNATWQRRGPTR